MRTELSESERRRDLPQQRYDVDVLDPALGVGVVLAPQPDELVEVVRAEDAPVPGQVVKVVQDDRDEEVEDEEGADDEEGDEVRVGKVGAAAGLAGVLALLVALDARVLLAAQHDLLPGLARRRAEEDEEGLKERLEVVVPVDVRALLRRDLAKDLRKDRALHRQVFRSDSGLQHTCC